MAGASHQIQIRHILVDNEELAKLVKETIEAGTSETGRVKLLMKLAEKYSRCASKEDGGNLGWLEVGWNPADPRRPRGGYKTLANKELNDHIHRGVADMKVLKGKVYGPLKTEEGYHVFMVTNEFKTERIL
jgi:hypothetical protein